MKIIIIEIVAIMLIITSTMLLNSNNNNNTAWKLGKYNSEVCFSFTHMGVQRKIERHCRSTHSRYHKLKIK